MVDLLVLLSQKCSCVITRTGNCISYRRYCRIWALCSIIYWRFCIQSDELLNSRISENFSTHSVRAVLLYTGYSVRTLHDQRIIRRPLVYSLINDPYNAVMHDSGITLFLAGIRILITGPYGLIIYTDYYGLIWIY